MRQLRNGKALIWLCLLFIQGTYGCVKEKDKDNDIVDLCPDNPNKTHPGVCGCDTEDVIDAYTGLYTCNQIDLCPNDPQKTKPGLCGCGVADTMGANGVPLCLMQNIDLCPADDSKTLPGICGCGVPDNVDPTTGVPNCLSEQIDLCPDDEAKTLPGVCGCGTPDSIDVETGIPTCTLEDLDFCPDDPEKTRPGICGCNAPDADSDGDGVFDCKDGCPEDIGKTEPGTCNCGVPDSNENLADDDSDHVPNCLDFCPQNPWKSTDDGCECDSLSYGLYGVSGCAQIIEDASDFLAFRDKWNAGEYDDENADAFILVQDINLGDELSAAEAAQWVPVGTEERPFNGLFMGNNHNIYAVHISGMQQETLTLGQHTTANMALFGYTANARLYDLRLDLVVRGSENVGGLIAIANATTVSNVSITGDLYGDSVVGGLVADAYGATLENITASNHIHASGDIAGGVVAQAIKCVLKSAGSAGDISAGQKTGGLLGAASQTTMINCYASGNVSGAAFTGGLVGEMVASKLYNAYTTTNVACHLQPCALLIARIGDSSTVKNAYTTGSLENLIPAEEPVGEPPVPGDSDNPDDPENPDDPGQTPEEKSSEMDVAALIASFGSTNNTVDMLYYWQLSELAALPEACSDMPTVSAPESFVYNNLRPYINLTTLLLTRLNGNLSCTNGLCILDSEQCQPWITRYVTIEIPGTEHKTMSVNLPVLDLQK